MAYKEEELNETRKKMFANNNNNIGQIEEANEVNNENNEHEREDGINMERTEKKGDERKYELNGGNNYSEEHDLNMEYEEDEKLEEEEANKENNSIKKRKGRACKENGEIRRKYKKYS